jgi:hypothetical protein
MCCLFWAYKLCGGRAAAIVRRGPTVARRSGGGQEAAARQRVGDRRSQEAADRNAGRTGASGEPLRACLLRQRARVGEGAPNGRSLRRFPG